MLVTGTEQVTRRRKFSRGEPSSNQPQEPAMFTRSQTTTTTTPSSGLSLKLPHTTTATITSTPAVLIPRTVVTSVDDSETDVGADVPSVSVTVTAVAASVLDSSGGTLTYTTVVPVLDTPTITSLVVNSLEGVHSGVPTRTTPTLTPTTLRNIEQTFLELSNVPVQEHHTNQAGFVPPLVNPNSGNTFVSVDSKCWGGGTLTQVPHTTGTSSTSSVSGSVVVRPASALATTTTTATTTTDSGTTGGPNLLTMPAQLQQPPRRMGGRRPIKDERLTHEEEERRSMRRERNKLAAARCRKRRLDQTNMLQDETDDLEDKKSELQQEIQLLQQQRDELEFLLATHKAVCRRRQQASAPPTVTVTTNPHRLVKPDVLVKEEPIDEDEPVRSKHTGGGISRPRRPTSLAVAPVALRAHSVADLGVPIETPSAGLRDLNFESMMEGGTGLTPVTSGTGLTPLHTGLTPLTTPVVSAPSVSVSTSNNCGSQQRSSSDLSNLSSPDSVAPKLVSL